MNLTNHSIGARLAWGFGSALLLFAATLVGLMISHASERTALLDAVDQAAAKQELAVQMRSRLLAAAVAVRNMGLETEVDAVQRDQEVAKTERAAYRRRDGAVLQGGGRPRGAVQYGAGRQGHHAEDRPAHAEGGCPAHGHQAGSLVGLVGTFKV